jgi:hypothetical protein
VVERPIKQLRMIGKPPGDKAAADTFIAGGREFAFQPPASLRPPPISPRPPAALTAEASLPPAVPPIGACSTGWRMLRSSVSFVRSAIFPSR